MSVEHGPVQHESGAERSELEAIAAKNKAERETTPEANPEKAAENQAESVEAARKIIDKQDQAPAEPAPAAEAKNPTPSFAGRLNQALSYRETMASLQAKLSPAKRQFSKVIHAPAVEKTSEVLEATVLRPSVTLGAVVTAFVVGGVFYYFAHRYGYAMRGSELILSLLVGGVLGLAVEGIGRMFRHHKA